MMTRPGSGVSCMAFDLWTCRKIVGCLRRRDSVMPCTGRVLQTPVANLIECYLNGTGQTECSDIRQATLKSFPALFVRSLFTIKKKVARGPYIVRTLHRVNHVAYVCPGIAIKCRLGPPRAFQLPAKRVPARASRHQRAGWDGRTRFDTGCTSWQGQGQARSFAKVGHSSSRNPA